MVNEQRKINSENGRNSAKMYKPVRLHSTIQLLGKYKTGTSLLSIAKVRQTCRNIYLEGPQGAVLSFGNDKNS